MLKTTTMYKIKQHIYVRNKYPIKDLKKKKKNIRQKMPTAIIKKKKN